ncbi:MAG: hypothetical protein COW84_10355 [Gammaproteobacteria bacterium CG22_combo_CG10-13_8_21_14_all_40_8]|nr:MAG: hypothetical protein COW84_10355 [Gammaproteobacteria bacterium CG22_combo_CG10-13_8_21_14_all_40_8]
MDVQGVVSIAARGNWSHEGKISLMIDDMEMNELSFATLQFGGHFPIDNIERIELIRGPGSAIYGGFAEMGVIKIITKNANTLKGTEGSVVVGVSKEGAIRKVGSFSTGKKFDNGSISANAYYSSSVRSDKDFSDFYDDTYNLKNNSDLDSVLLNLSGTYAGLSVRYLRDRYDVQQRDIFFVNAPYPVKESFDSDFIDIQYDWKLNNKLTITPGFNLKKQHPWKSTSQAVRDLEALDPDSFAGQFFDESLQRKTGKITGSYDFTEDDNLTFGASYYEDKDKTIDFSYHSTALFAQALIKTGFGNITLGARNESNSRVGSSFLPRVGYTNAWKKAHLKVLWSKAFRTPVVQNYVDFNDPFTGATGIKPESTTVFEIETGYQISNKLMLTANVYDIKITDPILYFFITADSYRNYPEVGTRGIELESRYKDDWGYLTVNFSHYEVHNNQVDQYAVQAIDPDLEDDFKPLVTNNQLLGVAPNKLTLNSSVKIAENWLLNSSAILEGSKYAYVGVTQDDDEQLIADKLSSTLLVNVNLVRKKLWNNQLDLQFGVFNLLDERVNYVQPYHDGFHAALPGSSREFFVRLKYHI